MSKNKKRKKLFIISSIVCLLTISSISFIYYKQSTKVEPIIGTYIDGEYSTTLPSKGSGYAVEKIVCDNNKSASWDYAKWGIKLSNWSIRSRCNIYFKSLDAVTIANKTFYLDEMQRCPTMNSDGTVTVTETENTYGYLCKAKDAYGDSYYYRGNVTNNYVKFADKYWRIVRINGDGTVRVIYDGTSAHANGESSEDRQIGTSAFNSSDDDNAYVGYMYGDRTIVEPTSQYATISFTNTSTYYIAKKYTYNASTDSFTLKDPIAVKGSAMTSRYVGYYTFRSVSASSYNSYVFKIFSVTAGSSSASIGFGYVRNATTSKEAAQTNKNDSTIKKYLDNWYKTNIVGTTNEQYLVDNVFCNDRLISSNKPFSSYTNKGYGNESTSYRWYNTGGSYNNKMMLACPQKNDAFTVNDTTKGNGALTYGIGLLTADEAALAGGWSSSNYNYYLYSGQNYWLASPSYFDSDAYGYLVYYVGYLHKRSVDDSCGARPVINLSSEILKNGDGTASNPYHA